MRRYALMILCLVLTAAALTGCGCTNRKMDNASAPTVLPTNEEVWESTHPSAEATTHPSTTPTTMATEHTEPSGTIDHGNGPLEDPTLATDNTVEGRARNSMPHTK